MYCHKINCGETVFFTHNTALYFATFVLKIYYLRVFVFFINTIINYYNITKKCLKKVDSRRLINVKQRYKKIIIISYNILIFLDDYFLLFILPESIIIYCLSSGS